MRKRASRCVFIPFISCWRIDEDWWNVEGLSGLSSSSRHTLLPTPHPIRRDHDRMFLHWAFASGKAHIFPDRLPSYSQKVERARNFSDRPEYTVSLFTYPWMKRWKDADLPRLHQVARVIWRSDHRWKGGIIVNSENSGLLWSRTPLSEFTK